LNKLRVLIVNDSPTMCAALRAALGLAPDLAVVGEVSNGSVAADAVVALRPDVVLMDVVMPGCDGYQATREIMARAPTPVVMVTAAENPDDERVIFQALGAGALTVSRAPPPPGSPAHRLASATLAQLLRSMAGANVGELGHSPPAVVRRVDDPPGQRVNAVGIVASAGGPPAVLAILRQLTPHAMPPILLVQHMSPGFAPGFARWLGDVSGYPVSVASHGETLLPRSLYLAPDEHHLGVGPNGTVLLATDAPIGQFRPSGDYLLSSLARAYGRATAGVVLSGMGNDGEAGAIAIAAAGGIVVAQDAASSAVDGMPRAVREHVASARTLPLDAIAGFLSTLANRQ
jgi:two-component system chemotaxis response regulator CheB